MLGKRKMQGPSTDDQLKKNPAASAKEGGKKGEKGRRGTAKREFGGQPGGKNQKKNN